jgi:hypothetical protein
LKVASAVVREASWIAAASFIGPRVEKLARGVVVAAGGVVYRNVAQIFWFAGTSAAAIRESICDEGAGFTHDASPT